VPFKHERFLNLYTSWEWGWNRGLDIHYSHVFSVCDDIQFGYLLFST